MSSGVVGRFAPSPSGRMHLGNFFCFLLAWLSARAAGGEIVLRIEDLDPDRSRVEYARQLEADLRFLGLDWDRGGLAGSSLAGGPDFVQSRRSEFYAEQLRKLEEQGLIYPCFCTRAQLHAPNAPHASDGEPVYSGRCRGLTAEEIEVLSKERSPALRLMVDEEPIAFTDGHYGPVSQNLQTACGDFILRRSDGVFAYQLAVAVDDAAMGVTQVVRGRDLLSSTPRQLYLYRLLGLEPPEYYHTPLLLAPDGRRLSKREKDVSLEVLQAQGMTGEEIVGRLAFLAGLIDAPEAVSAGELIPLFSWGKVPVEDIVLPRGLFETS